MNSIPPHHNKLLSADQLIREEADELIYRKGLHEILSAFGIPNYAGSYALKLMTWRDLDIYLDANISEQKFFELGGKIAEKFQPVKMSYRNERLARTEGLPLGFYWGVYLGDERAGNWKIDIWAMDELECRKRIEYCEQLRERITDVQRMHILEIKSRCWQHPLYRKSFSSSDIYFAVLNKGIENFEQFREWLGKIL